MAKLSIKKQELFKKRVSTLLLQMGAVATNMGGYEFAIDTPHCGKLYLSISDLGVTYTIYGNFLDNPEEAKEMFGHWKYNIHQSIECDMDEVLEFVKFKLNYVIH